MSVPYYTFLFLLSLGLEGGFGDFPKPRSRPCKDYVPEPKPELYGRISERKCQEYSWEMNDRIRKELHFSKCGIRKVGVSNGRPSKITEFPHMAAIGWEATDVEIKWEFLCGGSLISDRFVLTAAHCTWVRTDDKVADSVPKIVRLGTTYITEKTLHLSKEIENPTDIRINQTIRHEKYHSPKHYFDIALIKLEKSVKFSGFIQPACLYSKPNLNTSTRYKAAGWGNTKGFGNNRSPNLQSTELNIFDTKECMKFSFTNRNFDGIQEHQLCASGNNTDTCKGDSGGPLMYRKSEDNEETAQMHRIVGITSFGLTCTQKKTPGIYSKVSYFIEWIENNVWPEKLKSFMKQPMYIRKMLDELERTPPEIEESDIIFPDLLRSRRRPFATIRKKPTLIHLY